MSEPIGSRIWSEFTRLRNKSPKKLHRYGELPVKTYLYAGDGGTFACHVKERVKKGTWSLYRFGVEDLGADIALRDGSEPVRWEFAGGIIIDTSVAAFIPGLAFKEINALDDSEELTDAIDEALFGSDEDEAVLQTPEGRPFAVFRLAGDGTYDVVRGFDAEGAICALAVVE
jgi:hypothetical protein